MKTKFACFLVLLFSLSQLTLVPNVQAEPTLSELHERLLAQESRIEELQQALDKKDAVKHHSSAPVVEKEGQEVLITSSVRKDSPEFLLGKETGPNIHIASADNPDLKFHLGVRFMGTMEHSNITPRSGSSDSDWDVYARRVRLEAGASFTKNIKFMMDLRNDRANQDDRGEGSFNVGDAKLTIKKIFKQSWLNVAAYRAKVDVSRSQTVKSAFLVSYDRARVSDSAGNWVSHNRRASNVQLFGDWKKKFHYQLVVGDGVASRTFVDAAGNRAVGIDGQSSLMFGGKVKLSPFPGWEETRLTETYFGQGKHFTVGLGHFRQNGIDVEPSEDASNSKIDREVTNVEASVHYKGLMVQAEYFDFDGAIADFNASTLQVGEADGWYVLSEYVIPSLNYIAPFVRYDVWDRFSELDGFEEDSKIAGVNWYLLGNSAKIGLQYERRDLEGQIGDREEDIYRLTSQLFF